MFRFLRLPPPFRGQMAMEQSELDRLLTVRSSPSGEIHDDDECETTGEAKFVRVSVSDTATSPTYVYCFGDTSKHGERRQRSGSARCILDGWEGERQAIGGHETPQGPPEAEDPAKAFDSP